MSFEEFLFILVEDPEVKELINKCLDSPECGQKLVVILDHYYLKWLFLRSRKDIEHRITEEIKKAILSLF